MGFYFPRPGRWRTLIEHWNGEACKIQKSPKSTVNQQLRGVAATSRTDAWAVGGGDNGALIEHWNGKGWKG